MKGPFQGLEGCLTRDRSDPPISRKWKQSDSVCRDSGMDGMYGWPIPADWLDFRFECTVQCSVLYSLQVMRYKYKYQVLGLP